MLLALLVLLPAAINPAGVLAVEPLKASLLRAGAAVIVSAWLASRLLRAREVLPGPLVAVGAQPVVRAATLLLAASTLSTIFSLEPRLSFFGSFDRGMGWLSLAAGIALLFVGADLWVNGRRRERAITGLLVGTLVPCLYAFVQRLGWDPIAWTTRGAPGSTLGSPTFLGGLLVLAAPLAACRVVQAARDGASLRYAGWLALVLVIAATVAQTTIRGPLLGLAVGILTFATLVARRAGPQLRRLGLPGAVAFLIATFALAVTITGGAGVRGLTRFLDVQQPIDSSSERLTIWADALTMPLVAPGRALIGFGEESQPTLFEHAEASVRRTWAQRLDRAHNLALDTWLTGGLLGVLALGMTILAGAWCALGAYRKAPGGSSDSSSGLLPAALLGALAGHLVEVGVAFHSVVTGAWLFVVLGLAASLAPRLRPARPAPAPQLASLALGLGLLLVPMLGTPAVADAVYGEARRAGTAGDLRLAALTTESAARWAPWTEELARAAGLRWLQLARRTEPADESLFGRAEDDLLAAIDLAPFDPSPHLRLARLYQVWAEKDPGPRSVADLLDLSEVACVRALATGPYRMGVWETCARISALRGERELSERRAARAYDLRPNQ